MSQQELTTNDKAARAWAIYTTHFVVVTFEKLKEIYEGEADFEDSSDEDCEKVLQYFLDLIAPYDPEFAKIVEENKSLRERPEYHPEESAFIHIGKVFIRACYFAGYEFLHCNLTSRPVETTDNKVLALVVTALMHDMFKMRTLKYHPVHGYPQCPGHDKKAAEYFRNTQRNILQFSDELSDTIEWLIANHMRIAQIDEMRPHKQAELRDHPDFKYLEIFHQMDNMLKPFELRTAYNKLNQIVAN